MQPFRSTHKSHQPYIQVDCFVGAGSPAKREKNERWRNHEWELVERGTMVMSLYGEGVGDSAEVGMPTGLGSQTKHVHAWAMRSALGTDMLSVAICVEVTYFHA